MDIADTKLHCSYSNITSLYISTQALSRLRKGSNYAYIKSVFIESLDDLVIASEDSNICKHVEDEHG